MEHPNCPFFVAFSLYDAYNWNINRAVQHLRMQPYILTIEKEYFMSECENFQCFCKEIMDRIPDYLMQFDIDQVRLETVTKNNGIQFTGLVVALQEAGIVPNIYLDYYYARYRQGAAIEDIVQQIADEYRRVYEELRQENIQFHAMEQMEEKVFLKLVNRKRNETLLLDCPYVPFFDMAITFRYLVYMDEKGLASLQIRNRDMEAYGIDIEQLYTSGVENTKAWFPPRLNPLEDVVRGTVQCDFSQELDSGIYVLSNDRFINGATTLLNEEVLADFAREHGGDFYIIPSSIHELLLCPGHLGMDKELLESVLQDANEYVVSDMDYLSDQVYCYRTREGKIVL